MAQGRSPGGDHRAADRSRHLHNMLSACRCARDHDVHARSASSSVFPVARSLFLPPTGCPFCKWPSTAPSLVMDRRPLMGRGPVRKSPWGPRAWHWRGLQLRKWPWEEIGTSTLSHETKRSSDALKDPRIRRAVSTLVYATPLHPAQGHLPVNLHPPNSAVFWAGGLAGACRRRPCWSKMNRQDDHPRGCTAGPSRTRPPSGLPPPSSSWRCPSTPPRPTSWWQQQRLAVLTQRAGLLFRFIFK